MDYAKRSFLNPTGAPEGEEERLSWDDIDDRPIDYPSEALVSEEECEGHGGGWCKTCEQEAYNQKARAKAYLAYIGLRRNSDGTYVKAEDKVISTETAASLERRAEKMLAEAAKIREKYERFGEDDFPEGAVIVFDKRFNEYAGRSIPWSKYYHYAAMKGDGRWNTTGPKSPKSYTWDELIRWMGDGVDEIYYVSTMERFV
jgi:hypothetical protein